MAEKSNKIDIFVNFCKFSEPVLLICEKLKAKQSLYTPWWRLGKEEI
jgi:hypothetical protein